MKRAALTLATALTTLAFSLSARAVEASASPPQKHAAPHGISTGLQAPDVAPLMKGVVAESVHVFVYAGCFLALDDDQTCIEIAGKARDGIAPTS